jgi:hypothetical protein
MPSTQEQAVMNKYRWFELQADLSAEKVAKRLRAVKLSDNNRAGFVTRKSEMETDRFLLRFLDRVTVRMVVIGPRGVPEEQDLDTINAVDLAVFQLSSRTWLRVDDPPRSLRALLTSVEAAIGLGVAIRPVVASLATQRWALTSADSVSLISFKGIGGSVPHQAVARFEVAAKQGLVPEKLEFLRRLDFKIEQSTFEVVKEMTRGQISFAPTGMVRITGQLAPFLLQEVEKALLTG